MGKQLVRSHPFRPLLCIVLNDSGFHATTSAEFAEGFEQALSLKDKLAMRLRARQSAKRFTEEEFARKYILQMERLVRLRQLRAA
jgi:alpha-1,2-mannosyltransferase